MSLAFVTFRFIAGVKDAAPKAAYSLVFSGFAFIYFYVIPALDRIDAKLDAQRVAWVTMREEIKKDHERTRAVLLSNKESQIEARDVVGKFSEGQRIHASGISFILSIFLCCPYVLTFKLCHL